MPILYKQILSDRETFSFIAEEFNDDQKVLASVKEFGDNLLSQNTLNNLWNLLTSSLRSSETIYIDSEQITEVSKILCGHWNTLNDALKRKVEDIFNCIKADKKREGAIEKWLKRAEYPLSDFDELTVVNESGDGTKEVKIVEAWCNDGAKQTFVAVVSAFKGAQAALANTTEKGLRDRSDDVTAIKNYLDAVMAVLHLVKPLHVSAELNRDMDFYGEFDQLYDELAAVIPLYNRVRNYITRKPSESEKIKLMFDYSDFASGWSENEKGICAKRVIILVKDGKYYLGIINPKMVSSIKFENMPSPQGEDGYQKMVYKLVSDPKRDVPRIIFANKNKNKFQPTLQLKERYDNRDFKKDLAFCHQLIDYFKECIAKYESWKPFNFKFTPTSSYQDINEFYSEIEQQGYKISFQAIATQTIDDLVANGSLYLFRLHNKDFASGAKGTKNMHTLYLEALFNPENLKNGALFKLNGEAELFYRRAVDTKIVVHQVGQKMVNRIDKDGKTIPNDVFTELFAYANGKVSRDKLSSKALALVQSNKVTIKPVTHAITKDARYTKPKFLFHVPITINRSAGDIYKFNDRVNQYLAGHKDVNIIGIDRGERNLLYVTVINQKGQILEQRSFNTLSHTTYADKLVAVDYHEKLDQSEKARDAARKSWSEIGKIKDLKSGYLSIVIHEITTMMLKYNAFVVLEDLNVGFKRGRFAIEKQVYQKFEKALIDKLNYLVFKNTMPFEPGGLFKGYQLTDKFESFSKIRNQTGFLYYVPAAYTSKIDPTTGFVNLFDFKLYTNAESIQQFFEAFDAITYDAVAQTFKFTFDYAHFKCRCKGYKTQWTVYSATQRWVYNKDTKTQVAMDPTANIMSALRKLNINVTPNFDLKEFITSLPVNHSNASFFRDVFDAFKYTLQMRNSNSATGDDFIASPVRNANGVAFDSRHADLSLPQDADANGAYHIALKGLWLLQNNFTKLTLDEWFKFVQSRH